MTEPRQIVTTLYDRISARDIDGIAALLHPEFVSHNPRVVHDPATGSGKQAFVDFFHTEAGQRLLATPFRIQRILVDGDMVAVHNRVAPVGRPVHAIVDLFRIRDGLIVEQWDVIQQVPDELPHPHGMF
ncbi:nuclear transport factor 2 family protein [Amycolatopsis suaedae]|uniref:SnoaL-like domain-containing protein n=1 Tax=Amycolatopsis suaedae TaxID=2510978 RepID=A0A4Q7J082_9PSEU|nr:nuclear transport factor 2 family protein [Amycolatopsis suaedae]RZQ59773.1 hypothetical protein EWH70_32125 [Amycolatopsis suaedae]